MSVFGRLFGKKEGATLKVEGDVESLLRWRAILERDDLQIETDDPPLREQVAKGAAVDRIPGAKGEFGRDQDNPIPVNGEMGVLVYLSLLRTRDAGRRLYYHCLKMKWFGATQRLVGVYETVSTDGRVWDILYLSILHPKKTRLAPDGYTLAEPSDLQDVLYGVNWRNEDFPQDMDKVIADCMENQLDASQDSLRRELAGRHKGVRFERPPAHRERLERVDAPGQRLELGLEDVEPVSPEEMRMQMRKYAEENIGRAGELADWLYQEKGMPEPDGAERNLMELMMLTKTERLQNERSRAAVRDRIVNGLDVDELPDAKGEFGLDPDNPIPVNGPFGEQLYLSLLATEGSGQRLFHHRLGLKTGRLGPVAAYETVSADGEKWDILYLSARHPRKSTKAPAGYALVEDSGENLVLMRGVDRRAKNFPHGVRALVPKTWKEISGLDIPPPPRRLLDPAVRFRRPPEHRARLKAVTDGLADPRDGAGT